MFNPKYYNRYLDDYFDRQYYGARLKLKKFDTEEFQSLSYIYTAPGNGEEERIPTAVDVRNVSFHYNSFTPILNKISLQVYYYKGKRQSQIPMFGSMYFFP